MFNKPHSRNRKNNLKTHTTMKNTYYIPQTDLIRLSGSLLQQHAVSGDDLPPEPAPAHLMPGNKKMLN